ncbi:MAG: hypothetical protein HGA98_00145 [Deltaproteobacteria bacterium]|nr:hypothetical protein [Deltaproteobacteria bacterium]
MKGDGVSLVELTEAQHAALVTLLEKVRLEHGARMALLAETCGRPLALSAPDAGVDLDALASLAASAVAATLRLGALFGEPGATLVLQRGDRDVLFLEPSGDLIVAVVLEEVHPRGLERVRARLRLRRALSEMRGVLVGPGSGGGLGPIEDADLEALLAPLSPSAP